MRIVLFLCSVIFCFRAAGDQIQFSFGELSANGSLTNFHAEVLGEGKPSAWKVLPGEAPSAFASLTDPAKNVAGGAALAQLSQDPTDEHFPMYVYDGDRFRNFKFSTQFKLVSGVMEQMAGVVFRFQNTSNFYVVRVSGLGRNIKFYKVVNGDRSNPIGVPCDITPGTWHQLGVQCDGNQITIYLDNKLVMPPLGDNTFSDGKIGFWTKSDAVTYFANASIDYVPIIPPVQVLLDSVMHEEPRILGLQIYTLTTNNTTRVLASKEPSEKGQPGTDAELAAIRQGTVSFGRKHNADYVTMPLHDRNGDYIAAVRIQLKSFFGETQDNAVNRALLIIKMMQQFGLSAEDLAKE